MHPQPTGALIVRTGPAGQPFYEAKWIRAGRQVMRRIGPAWAERDDDGHWRRRPGRVPADHFDAKRATVRMAELIAEHDRDERAVEAGARDRREKGPTVRDLAGEWLGWLEQVKGAKPSTLRDYRSLLAEPGTQHKRGAGKAEGQVMRDLGDQRARDVTVRDVARFLRSLDRAGCSARQVNKRRQVLHAIFTYAMRDDVLALPSNPVAATDKRREAPPVALDFYEPHEIEALARAAHDGRHRHAAPAGTSPDELAARGAEDAQDGELLRVLSYTGLRLGEALVLRWADVDFTAGHVIVRRALSSGIETSTKSHRVRHVALATPAAQALARLGQREGFTGREDYVFCSRLGGRLDGSALRRRYKRAQAAAGLRPLTLHGLRHTAGSLLAREADAIYVQHFLGHSALATTERYMHAKPRPQDLARLDRAFSAEQPPSPAPAGQPRSFVI